MPRLFLFVTKFPNLAVKQYTIHNSKTENKTKNQNKDNEKIMSK